MKKTALYPVTPENQYLLHNLNMNQKYHITAAVVPNAFRKQVNLEEFEVYSTLDEALSNVSAVVFVMAWDKNRVLNEMKMVLAKGVAVISTFELSSKETNDLYKIASTSGSSYSTTSNKRLLELLNTREDPYLQPESIVIAVSSIIKGIKTSALVSGLASSLIQKGYQVGAIFSDPDLSLYENFETLPLDPMISKDLDRCIMKVNNYFTLYQLKYKPDIIIVQLPNEGLCRLSYEMRSCFGARTYLISQAVDFDYGIVLSPIMSSDAELYQRLSDDFNKRFGFSIDSVCVMPKETKLEMAHGEENVRYYSISTSVVEQTVRDLCNQETDITFYQFSPDILDSLAEDVISHLS